MGVRAWVKRHFHVMLCVCHHVAPLAKHKINTRPRLIISKWGIFFPSSCGAWARRGFKRVWCSGWVHLLFKVKSDCNENSGSSESILWNISHGAIHSVATCSLEACKEKAVRLKRKLITPLGIKTLPDNGVKSWVQFLFRSLEKGGKMWDAWESCSTSIFFRF